MTHFIVFIKLGLTMLPIFFAKLSAGINPFIVRRKKISFQHWMTLNFYKICHKYSLNHPKVKMEMVRLFRCIVMVAKENNEYGSDQQADDDPQSSAVHSKSSRRNKRSGSFASQMDSVSKELSEAYQVDVLRPQRRRRRRKRNRRGRSCTFW